MWPSTKAVKSNIDVIKTDGAHATDSNSDTSIAVTITPLTVMANSN